MASFRRKIYLLFALSAVSKAQFPRGHMGPRDRHSFVIPDDHESNSWRLEAHGIVPSWKSSLVWVRDDHYGIGTTLSDLATQIMHYAFLTDRYLIIYSHILNMWCRLVDCKLTQVTEIGFDKRPQVNSILPFQVHQLPTHTHTHCRRRRQPPTSPFGAGAS